MPCENWSYFTISQETIRYQEKDLKPTIPWCLYKRQGPWYLDLGLLPSRKPIQQSSVVWATSFVIICYDSPKKLLHLVTHLFMCSFSLHFQASMSISLNRNQSHFLNYGALKLFNRIFWYKVPMSSAFPRFPAASLCVFVFSNSETFHT